MNLQQILANNSLTLERQFSIIALEKMDLNNVSKQQLLEVLVSTMNQFYLKDNILKEVFKADLLG